MKLTKPLNSLSTTKLSRFISHFSIIISVLSLQLLLNSLYKSLVYQSLSGIWSNICFNILVLQYIYFSPSTNADISCCLNSTIISRTLESESPDVTNQQTILCSASSREAAICSCCPCSHNMAGYVASNDT